MRIAVPSTCRIACMSAVCALACCVARAQSSYQMKDLGIGEALGVNAAGAVVGFLWNPATNVYTGFKWQNNILTTLTPPDGYSGFIAYRINSAGEIAGYWNSASGYPYSRAAYYSPATGAVDLNSRLSADDQAAWYLVTAWLLNDAGIVIGEGIVNGVDTQYRLDLRTSPPTITQLPLPQPGWSGSDVTGLNNSGLMCGWSVNNASRTRTGFVLSGGVYTSLPLYNAFAVNDAGDVAGQAYVNKIGYQAAFLPYGASSPTICGSLNLGSIPKDLNLPTNGFPKTVVGDSSLKSGPPRGFRWQVGGSMVDLTTKVSNLPGKKWSVTTAQAINGSGVIVGQANDGTYGHAIVLTP